MFLNTYEGLLHIYISEILLISSELFQRKVICMNHVVLEPKIDQMVLLELELIHHMLFIFFFFLDSNVFLSHHKGRLF